MENKFQRIIITGDKKLQEAKYDCIELLYTNGREDLIDILLSLNGSNKMNNEIEELQSIVAKNGRPDLLKLIESSIIT
jgi:hypothetical protein